MGVGKTISTGIYKVYEDKLREEVLKEPIPKHVAIIMDGNRRFAKELGLEPIEGHQVGKDKLEEVLELCLDLGIKVLTVYTFSTENINRSTEEVERLMDLFARGFKEAAEDARVHEHGVKIKAIGKLDLLPTKVQEAIRYAEQRTAGYNNYFFNIAIAYGGREEILQGVKRLVKDAKSGKIKEDEIDENLFSTYLYTAKTPDPDLVLRTSNEERVSNFLLWQLAYAELYFTDVYWPGLRKLDFLRAIRCYQQRKRRFGR